MNFDHPRRLVQPPAFRRNSRRKDQLTVRWKAQVTMTVILRQVIRLSPKRNLISPTSLLHLTFVVLDTSAATTTHAKIGLALRLVLRNLLVCISRNQPKWKCRFLPVDNIQNILSVSPPYWHSSWNSTFWTFCVNMDTSYGDIFGHIMWLSGVRKVFVDQIIVKHLYVYKPFFPILQFSTCGIPRFASGVYTCRIPLLRFGCFICV